MDWKQMFSTAVGVFVALIAYTLLASGFNDAQDEWHFSIPVESRVDQALSDAAEAEREAEEAIGEECVGKNTGQPIDCGHPNAEPAFGD